MENHSCLSSSEGEEKRQIRKKKSEELPNLSSESHQKWFYRGGGKGRREDATTIWGRSGHKGNLFQ